MATFFYFLATFVHSGLSVFGLRGSYDQPVYRVVRTLAPDVELRAYAPRATVETVVAGDEGQAFGRLFRYITGANAAHANIRMTVPVERAGRHIAMTVPVEEQGADPVMRFYLPPDVAADPPDPTEPGVRIVRLPAVTLGVIRYSGTATQAARLAQTARLRSVLRQSGGEPIYLSYDPPFAVPFLRRNEVAIEEK